MNGIKLLFGISGLRRALTSVFLFGLHLGAGQVIQNLLTTGRPFR